MMPVGGASVLAYVVLHCAKESTECGKGNGLPDVVRNLIALKYLSQYLDLVQLSFVLSKTEGHEICVAVFHNAVQVSAFC